MSLLPRNGTEELDSLLETQRRERRQPSKTYRLDFSTGRLGGMIDDKDAIKQFIVMAVKTIRSHHHIYSDDYGCEIKQLIGRNISDSFLQAEIPRMVREALIYDDRINSVTGIEVTRRGDAIYITATVDSIFGTVSQEVII